MAGGRRSIHRSQVDVAATRRDRRRARAEDDRAAERVRERPAASAALPVAVGLPAARPSAARSAPARRAYTVRHSIAGCVFGRGGTCQSGRLSGGRTSVSLAALAPTAPPPPLGLVGATALPAALPRDVRVRASGTGSRSIALQVDVYDRTALRAGGSGRCSSANILPAVFIGLLLGPLVDRLSRKRLMIGSDVVRARRVRAAAVRDERRRDRRARRSSPGSATPSSGRRSSPASPNLVDEPTTCRTRTRCSSSSSGRRRRSGRSSAACSSLRRGRTSRTGVNAATFAVSALLVAADPGRAAPERARDRARALARPRATGFALVRDSRPLATVLVAWSIAIVATRRRQRRRDLPREGDPRRRRLRLRAAVGGDRRRARRRRLRRVAAGSRRLGDRARVRRVRSRSSPPASPPRRRAERLDRGRRRWSCSGSGNGTAVVANSTSCSAARPTGCAAARSRCS